MKNFTKIILSILFTLNLLPFTVSALTNVSGGIYANTTWTLNNSPYIVVGTVVVFPGVTLTIQPGVTVKFNDGMHIEIRQATLIANGTSTDSITFTSNSNTPYRGIWDKIWLNQGSQLLSQFNYCSFQYGKYSLYDAYYDSLIVKNSSFYNNIYALLDISGYSFKLDSSNFTYNTVGFAGGSSLLDNISNCNFKYNTVGLGDTSNDIDCTATIRNCVIDSNQTGINYFNGIVDKCIIKYNQTGLQTFAADFTTIKNCIIDSNVVAGLDFMGGAGLWPDTVFNNEIKYNGTGLINNGSAQDLFHHNIIQYNNIGIKLMVSGTIIYCNKICNNSTWDLYYTIAFNNCSVADNNWCSTDSVTIHSHIYDGYTNINLGLISVFPVDLNNCYLITDRKST